MGLTGYSLQKKRGNGEHPKSQAEYIGKCARAQEQKVRTTDRRGSLRGSQRKDTEVRTTTDGTSGIT